MQHVNRLLESDGVNHAESISPMIFHNFQDTRPFTFPALCRGWRTALLNHAEGITHVIHHIFGKSEQILFG